MLLQDGRCKHICSAGSYLLSDCKLDTNAKFDVAFADSDVAFTTSILCVPQTLPAITFGFATPPTKSPRNEDSFSVVAVNANAELVVTDAQAFAAFAGFTPATLDTLVKDNGKLIVLLRDLGKEVMQQYLVNEFADKDPKDLPMYQLSIAHYMQTEMSTLLQSKAGLKVNRLAFNNGTPSVTFEANPLTTLLKQARMTRSFSGDATLYMPGHPEQKATISVKGQYALDVADKERFFSRPEAQQLEALIKDSLLPEDYEQPCEDYFGSLVSPADVSAILQSEAQRLVNDGTISDLRDANQYLSLSGLVKMRLDEKLRLNGLGMYSLSMDLPAVIVSKALADKYNLPEKQRQLRNAVQEPLTLTTAPVDIHAPGNDHTRKIQAIFKGQCLMRVSDEYTFFADSVADDFLHSDRPIAKPEVTAKYASLLNPLFGDVLRSVIQSVVNNLNADIRDINVLTANVKSSIIASMSMRAGVYGLSLASIDMLPTDVIFTSPTLLQQGSVESAISGDELRRKLEELENNHVIFTAQEDGRVKIAKNGVEIEVLKSDDQVAEAHSQFDAKAENRTHEVNKVKIEHAAELDEMEDEATRLQQERNYAAQLRDLKHRFMMRDEALEQKIREDERLQNAQIAAERRDRDNAFAKLLETAENKKALNDIMHKIDESDLEWREKLDQYARMQKRTQVQDDAETARVQADTSVYTANANLGIQHQQDERFYGMVSKKIQLSAAEAELLERIKQYDEDRHERVTAANEARAERRSTLTFEQRLQDRREQVAQQMEQLQQQYDQVLALRDKDEKLAQLQVDFDKYALQIQAYDNYIATRYGAEVAMEASRQATKAAEAKYGAEAATAYAAMEAMRLDAQTKREDSIAARADALGTVDLVRRYRDKIGAEGDRCKRDLQKSLHRIRMNDAVGVDGFCIIGDGTEVIDRTRFVVDQHHRDQKRIARHLTAELLHVKYAVFCGNIRRAEALCLQRLHRAKNGGMLGIGRDDLAAGQRLFGMCRADDGEVVRFRSRCREDQVFFLCAADTEGGEHLLTCLFQNGMCGSSHRMARGGIAPDLVHDRKHGISCLFAQRRCRAVVKIDRLHDRRYQRKYRWERMSLTSSRLDS